MAGFAEERLSLRAVLCCAWYKGRTTTGHSLCLQDNLRCLHIVIPGLQTKVKDLIGLHAVSAQTLNSGPAQTSLHVKSMQYW